MFAAIIDREAFELSALLTIFVHDLQSSKSPANGVVGLWLMAKLKSL